MSRDPRAERFKVSGEAILHLADRNGQFIPYRRAWSRDKTCSANSQFVTPDRVLGLPFLAR
jgi:hypothetical protein